MRDISSPDNIELRYRYNRYKKYLRKLQTQKRKLNSQDDLSNRFPIGWRGPTKLNTKKSLNDRLGELKEFNILSKDLQAQTLRLLSEMFSEEDISEVDLSNQAQKFINGHVTLNKMINFDVAEKLQEMIKKEKTRKSLVKVTSQHEFDVLERLFERCERNKRL